MLRRLFLAQHFFKFPCSDAGRLGWIFDEADGACRKLAVKPNLKDLFFEQCFHGDLFRQKTDAKIVFDQGKNLLGCGDFDIRAQRNSVLKEETSVVIVRIGLVVEQDKWIFCSLRK